MNKTFPCMIAVVAAIAVSAQAADNSKAAKEKEQALIKVLQSDAPEAEKAMTCKRLAIHGTRNAVPELAPLLGNERLASWARIALEAIPGPEADQALREAAASLQGRLLIGAINAIGVRRDAKAVDALAKRLKDADAQVASAAAVALGKIGNSPATKALRGSLAGASGEVRSAVAEGCILCAEQALADGQAKQAIEIYDEVRQAKVPQQRILEATRGAILARKSDGVPLLVEQLRSPDKRRFQIGLSTARELSGSEVTKALAAEVARTKPDRGALLLAALAARGDATASPIVLQAAQAGPKQVRIAALGVLGRLSDAAAVPTLLEIAVASDPDLAEAAKLALVQLPGKDVDAQIAARLPKAEGKLLLLLIELAGERRIAAAPALLKAVNHPDAQIRSAALMALGATVAASDLSALISLVADPKNPEDIASAQQALRVACIRMPDVDQCAQQLVSAMAGRPAATQRSFLEVLGAMGGTQSLQAIGTAAKSADPELQDTGSRLLGKWMTVDAAPVLLDLAKTAPEEKYQVRALRGYLRLARQFSMPVGQRSEMCRQALDASKRTTEQKLVLEVLERYPSIEMLTVAVQAAKIPAIKDDATQTATAIAQKLGGKTSGVNELLEQIGQKPVN